MNEDILSLLEYKMPTFSKGQRRIAVLIWENYDKTAFLTASQLGKQAGVSESTVVRFAMELGYDGYPQMQKAMQETVLNTLSSMQRMGVAQNRMGNRDIISTVLQNDAELLRQTVQSVERADFEKAVNTLLSAKNIYIVGIRSAAAMASFLGYYLQHMLDRVHIITHTDCGMLLEQMIHVQAGDAVLAFSFPRHCTATLEAVAYCRSAGATVIGITNSSLSPLTEFCDCVLLAKTDMVSVVDSLVAPMSLVNALIVALAAEKEDTLRSRLEKLETIWKSHNVYEKNGENL